MRLAAYGGQCEASRISTNWVKVQLIDYER